MTSSEAPVWIIKTNWQQLDEIDSRIYKLQIKATLYIFEMAFLYKCKSYVFLIPQYQ